MALPSKKIALRATAILGIAAIAMFLVIVQWPYHVKHRVLTSFSQVTDQEEMVVLNSDSSSSSSTDNTNITNNHQESLLPPNPDDELQDVRLKYSLLRRMYSTSDSTFSAQEQMDSSFIPSQVHYVWCGERWFCFKEFLSVMSVIRMVRPDSITIHYDTLPTMDKKYYHQWLDDLKYEYPFLHMEQLSKDQLLVCDKDAEPSRRLGVIKQFLDKDGGLYVSFNTWFIKFTAQQRDTDLEYAVDEGTLDGYIIQRASPPKEANTTYATMLQSSHVKSRRSSCIGIHHFYQHGEKASCLLTNDEKLINKDFYPMHIWELDSAFGRLARGLFYGTEEIHQPQPSYDELVPNIGHMIWLGGRGMDFVFYLSALSVLYVVNVDMLYIHGDQEPGGEYWPQLKKDPRVKFILRGQPNWVYQGEIPSKYKSLMSDIIRCDLMIKYGGIYTDTDAIWVKPLSYEERGYEAVASYDWIDWSYPFPDSVNMGISYGKKNAPFWQIFRESMRVLHNTSPGYTGVQMPYKLLEKYPDLLRIDRHLSVICYRFRCHPTWVEDYHNMKNDHVTSNSIPNWREDVHAFHWTHPNPPEYANMSALLNGEGLFADIGKNVLMKAGLIPNSTNSI